MQVGDWFILVASVLYLIATVAHFSARRRRWGLGVINLLTAVLLWYNLWLRLRGRS